MAINDIVQTIAEARVDARSLSEFVFKPAGFKVARRLAPTIDTLQFYINRFDNLDDVFSYSVATAQQSLNSAVAEAQGKVAYIESTVQDAINNTAIEGGILADTFVTVTPNRVGSIPQTLRDLLSERISVERFGAVGDGVTDDYIAIQKAIDATPNKGVLHLGLAKTYYCSQGLTGVKSINIIGNGSKIISDAETALLIQGTFKDTKSVTTDYVKGSTTLTLDSTAGIVVGDLLNIVSTELYNKQRYYYFKGGNLLVSEISGNQVTLSMPIPFDIPASTISVRVYDPVSVTTQGFDVVGAGVLPDNKNGVHIKWAKNCITKDMFIDNFCANMLYARCVNVYSSHVNTGRAKPDQYDLWDGYGHAIASCTNVLITNSISKSGQHAITWGGRETNFNIVIDNCILDFEISFSVSIGNHDNAHNVTIRNTTMHGFSASGNFKMENCDVYLGDTTRTDMYLSPSHNPEQANFIFDNVRFHGANLAFRAFFWLDAYDLVSNSLTLRNCTGIGTLTVGSKIREPTVNHTVNSINISGCTPMWLRVYDDVKNITVSDIDVGKKLDGTQDRDVTKLLSQEKVPDVADGKIGKLTLHNLVMPNIFNSLIVDNVDSITLENVTVDNVDTIYADNAGISLSNVEKVLINNSDLSTHLTRGVDLINIGNLGISNSNIMFRRGVVGPEGLKGAVFVAVSNLTENGVIYNAFTTPDGSKYLQSFGNDGIAVNTLLV